MWFVGPGAVASTPPAHQACSHVQGLLEILSAASEFDAIPMRPGEEDAVRKLLAHAPLAVERARYTDPHTKANALLQAHFTRNVKDAKGNLLVKADLITDQRAILVEASRLLQAPPPPLPGLGSVRLTTCHGRLCTSARSPPPVARPPRTSVASGGALSVLP